MKIYHLENRLKKRAEEKRIINKLSGLSGLKIAAGGEDMVIISEEAMACYKKYSTENLQYQELKKLALKHIHDRYSWMNDLGNDQEFIRAEKLSLIAELIIRTVSVDAIGKI